MGVPSAGGIGAVGHPFFLGNSPMFFRYIPVKMVGGLFNYAVQMRVEVRPVHPAITCIGYHMKQVPNDRVDNEHLAMFVKIKTPWIGSALRDKFINLVKRVITPNATIGWRSL